MHCLGAQHSSASAQGINVCREVFAQLLFKLRSASGHGFDREVDDCVLITRVRLRLESNEPVAVTGV